MKLKLKDIAPSPFISWHILLGKVAKVAASDSSLNAKQASQFVCNGREDACQINEAIEHLNYQYGDWEWRELRRCKEWRWPWQPKTRITKLGEGGTIYLSEGVFNVGEASEITER